MRTGWDEMEGAMIRANKRVLMSQGRRKFEDPPAKTEAALMAIKELARLERMTDSILDANSWKELMAVR